MSIFSCIENGSFRSIFRAQLARKNLQKISEPKNAKKLHYKKANFGEKIRFHTANFWENEISKRRVLSVCVILKCLIFEFSPFEKHVAIWHLIGNRNTQKFICTSHAINQSLRSWNLLCLCHYSLTLFFLFQILILLVNFAKSWLRRLFGMPEKSWTKKVEIFHQRNFYDEWNSTCGFFPC